MDEQLERGDTLILKRSGLRLMVRRIERPTRRTGDRAVVLFDLRYGVELNQPHGLGYLLDRLAKGSIKRGRRLDAARVIHDASVRNRQRGGVADGDQ